ncbi:hypothetical protein TWF506_003672 [Arthrobotrys conoides]|uniref:Uncharacterized protein n=1 Tax=Arthrobotrys conoides TaxID=74498 RepID=A0AAN8RK15_9PEZI
MWSAAAAYAEGFGERRSDEWPLGESPAGPSSQPHVNYTPPTYAPRSRVSHYSISPGTQTEPPSYHEGNTPAPSYVTPPFLPSNLLRHTVSTPAIRPVPFLKSRKPSLRKRLSQPTMLGENMRTRRKIERDYREYREQIERQPLDAEDYANILRERVNDAVRLQGQKANDNSGGRLFPDEIVHEVCLAVCYNALHRRDEAVHRAILKLRDMDKRVRIELSEFVKSVIKNSGGSMVDLVVAERWEGFMRNVLGSLGADWGKGEVVVMNKWSSEKRKWELRKFCGIVWYALKVFEGQIDPSAETIPDYAVRMSGGIEEIPKDITILCPYFLERKKVRNQIRRYLNQLFEPACWEKLGHLLWVVTPSTALPVVRDLDEERKSGNHEKLSLVFDDIDVVNIQPGDDFIYKETGESSFNVEDVDPERPKGVPKVEIKSTGSDPRIVMIQLGRAQFAIYRIFEASDGVEYHKFLASVRKLDKTMGTRVARRDLMEFFRVGDAWEDEKQRIVKAKVDEAARMVGHGSLSGEVRYMYACLEAGIEMAYTTRQGAWLGVSEVIDGIPDRLEVDSVFRGFSGEFTDELRIGDLDVEPGMERYAGRSSEEIRRTKFNKQVSDGVWSYYGFRVFDVKYDTEPKTLKFLDTALTARKNPNWINFGVPKDWQKGHIQLPWEAAYREFQDPGIGMLITFDIDEVGRMISPIWKQVLLRKVERDREILMETIWGDIIGGKPLKGLKDRSGKWYGSWNYGRSGGRKGFLGLWGGKDRVSEDKRERMRIKEVEVLGFEGWECWDGVWEKEMFRRVFEE